MAERAEPPPSIMRHSLRSLFDNGFRPSSSRTYDFASARAASRFVFSNPWDVHTIRSLIGPTTSHVYQKWARKERQEISTDVLHEGAKLHWIGPRRDASQDRIFLYFPGGGVIFPARSEYFQFIRALQKDVSASLGDVGVALLEYSLAPESPCSTRLKQANAALTHLLNKGIPPANIIVGGDSAGGNLILQLTSHILHPLPSIPAPVLAQPLADLLPAHFYRSIENLNKEGRTPELEHYVEVVSAPAAWWNGLNGVCARFFVTAGKNECFFDHIIEMGTIVSQNVPDTTTVAEPGAVHEEVIVKFVTGEGGSGKDYDAIVAFLSRSFQGVT
ncbi:Alpha/Beta hydrolase protein [Russula brevipes]|nr:Alpha/Beta hydrolase protein [Russula brevipes]